MDQTNFKIYFNVMNQNGEIITNYESRYFCGKEMKMTCFVSSLGEFFRLFVGTSFEDKKLVEIDKELSFEDFLIQNKIPIKQGAFNSRIVRLSQELENYKNKRFFLM